MAALHRVSQLSAAGPSCTTGLGESKPSADKFPDGLKVLVVDDDDTCLKIVVQMLRRCKYDVTPCTKATVALKILREKKGFFNVVLSDVHMPDIDGFKLLEHIGLEMDLPVIMMSADGSTSAVMKGVRHGACDYLIKPIRAEELKNIWQHVIRKKWNGNREFEQSGSLDDIDRHRRANDDVEYASSVNEEAEGLKGSKKRSNNKEEDDSEPDNDDPSTSKKARVVWSVELHQQFVSAVNQLGLDKAVPKRILELMNVPGLTRENVASHLQKFRLYLKRLSLGGGPQQPNVISNTFCGAVEPNIKLGSVCGFDFQSLAESGQIPPQTLAALHAELIGRPTTKLGPTVESPALLHSSLLGPKRVPVDNGMVFGQHPVKCQSNIFKQFPSAVLSVDASRFGSWTNIANNNPGGFSNQNNNLLMDIMQQQKQLQQPVLPEPSRSINVQPSCLVVPTQSSTNFQAVGSPASVNQNCSFNRSSAIDYTILSPQSNTTVLNGASNGDNKTTCVPTGFSALASSTNLSAGSLNSDNSTISPNQILSVSGVRQLTGHGPCLADIQASYGSNTGELLDQGPFRNPGYVSKGTSIPLRFAVDEYESPTSNLNHRKNSVIPVKLEPNVEFMGYESLVLQQFPSNDLMSVVTK